jgi:hypothetical protein
LDERLCRNTLRTDQGYVLLSISKPLALFWRSRSALSKSAARFLAALSALILAWSAVGGLMISVIRIKYLAWRSGLFSPPHLQVL